MHRLTKIANQVVLPEPVAFKAGGDTAAIDKAVAFVDGSALKLSRDEKQQRVNEYFKLAKEYGQGINNLKTEGTAPAITAWDLTVLQNRIRTQETMGRKTYGLAIQDAEARGALAVMECLPGPWRLATTQADKIALMQEVDGAIDQGRNVQLWAEWQQRYARQGLGGNIVVPRFAPKGLDGQLHLAPCVVLAHPADAERIAQTHVRKDGSFEPFLLDSVIATTEDEHWRKQRRQLAEVFLPLSSLAEVLPISRARARACGERLAEAAASGVPVDMSDFMLHEAQAQLQLALLGLPEEFMEATNKKLRQNFAVLPEAPAGAIGETLKAVLKIAREGSSFALPSDGGRIHGPLMRALQTSEAGHTADWGNALLILFAGHDTTGHAMTWLLFELARHPESQRELLREVDLFFEVLGGRDPEYTDLSKLTFMDRCITETLRLWNSVPSGTFRQLHFDDWVTGDDGEHVTLPRGTVVNIVNWSRHRNPALWGEDANEFNPYRDFEPSELARVGCPMAAATPQSQRFSPFAHNPRSCLGRNFAQMEMRLIMAFLLRRYTFTLAPPYDELVHTKAFDAMASDPDAFRGVNRATMGPMNLVDSPEMPWGKFHTVGLYMNVHPRNGSSRIQ